MGKRKWALIVAYSVVLLASRAGPAAETGETRESAAAEAVLAASGIEGGVVVHVGCGNGTLTAALRANNSFLVHGLDTDAGHIKRARGYLLARGHDGTVSVQQFDGRRLPYVDELVNLVVISGECQVSRDEIARILAPGGVAVQLDSEAGTLSPDVLFRKPWPQEIDEWTHFLHDASNNGVAQDTRLGPPRRLKWKCGPAWLRSHEHTSSMVAMVSGAGRLFYIFDEGLTGVTPQSLPEKWTLCARDAFNGVLLWKRPLENFRGGRWNNRSLRGIPGWVRRLLVAHEDRIYVPLALDAPVSMLDAATGRVLTTLEKTHGARELRCLDDVLLVHKERGGIEAFDAVDGKPLWRARYSPRPSTLAAHRERVYFLQGPEVVCLDLNTGEPIWKTASDQKTGRRRAPSLVIPYQDRVLVADGGQLSALTADTGERLWSVPATLGGRGELFVARAQAWHWKNNGFVGHDLKTGEIKTTVDPSEVFTPGHHLRCYQSKATEKYVITPFRGVEFVSISGEEHTQNDWVRGACAYGIMPANGLLYAPPHPCFCYPGVKLTGFNALAPAGEERPFLAVDDEQRLKKGPAYDDAAQLAAQQMGHENWPMYRHDGRRTGATDAAVSAALTSSWTATVTGELTPPVVAEDRVFVARKQAHVLCALDADSGRRLWDYVADGRIDSPPTVLGGLVFFGSDDGFVYCLRADDGQLAWRFQAAPSRQKIVCDNRLVSPWPVHGSVLEHDGVIYCTAGRSTYLDGGIRMFGLDPKTGAVLHRNVLDTWSRTRDDAVNKPFVPAYHMEGSLTDILVCQNDSIYLGQYKLNRSLARQACPYAIPEDDEKQPVAMDLTDKPFVSEDVEETQDLEEHQRDWLERNARGIVTELRKKHGAFNVGHRRMGRHLLTTFGFLDDSWFNRTYWMYSETWPGFYLGHRAAKAGQLLVVGPEKTYAVQAYPRRNMQSPLFTPGKKGYLLLADANDNEPVLDYHTRETTKGWGFTRKQPPVWHRWVSLRIRAMALAGQTLFVAGPPDIVDPDDPMGAFEGRKGGFVRAYDATDGHTISERELSSPPVFDGMAAARGRLYVSLRDGRLVCFRD